jgi:hypothetical protein
VEPFAIKLIDDLSLASEAPHHYQSLCGAEFPARTINNRPAMPIPSYGAVSEFLSGT